MWNGHTRLVSFLFPHTHTHARACAWGGDFVGLTQVPESQAAMTANPAAPRYGLCGLPDQVFVCALLFLPSGGASELGVDPRRAASSSLRWERSAARRHSSPSSLRRSCRGTTATPRATDHTRLYVIKQGLVISVFKAMHVMK